MITYLLRHRTVTATLFFLAFFAILWFSFTQTTPDMRIETDTSNFRMDYLLHAIAYFGLMVLFGIWQHKWLCTIRQWVATIFLGLLMAGGTELGQAFVPSRTVNPFDLLANCGGLLGGLLFSYLLIRRNKETIPRESG